MNAVTDDALAQYFATRQQQRTDRVEEFLGTLTPRERWLLREGMVMGYVLGDRRGAATAATRWTAGAEEFPGDAEIVASVVAHCQSTADLYPVIAGSPYQLVLKLARAAERPVTLIELTEWVRLLMPGHADEVAGIVAEYVADEEMAEMADGLVLR